MGGTLEERYNSTVDYLYSNLPMFQRDGASAYKKDLYNTIALCNHLGNPQTQFNSIHIAGTNGKGSCSHFLAAIFQQAGYKTGLYTSPHLKSFTERIRVDGIEIDKSYVIDFTKKHKEYIDALKPSFFEITVGMAFSYFADQEVDIAIVEVGMGGRLDSTNILNPLVSLITNIGMDHQQFLGDTLKKIALEKGGIIKENVPVVISETQPETELLFKELGRARNTSSHFADQETSVSERDEHWVFTRNREYSISANRFPEYQKNNLKAVISVAEMLMERFQIEQDHIKSGIENVQALTGLLGRWQQLDQSPDIFCDVGHNEDGVKHLMRQIGRQRFNKLFIIWGTVKDKELSPILSLLPESAQYVFCEADIPRALPAAELQEQAQAHGLGGVVIEDVNDALRYCLTKASKDDLIVVGGSNFVVAELDNLK